MAREAAYRKYQLTINNPLEHGFSHEVIKQILGEFKSFIYGCLGDEIGAQPHTHVYVVFKNAVMRHFCDASMRSMKCCPKMPTRRFKGGCGC